VFSMNHKRPIDLKMFASFVGAMIPRPHNHHYHVNKNRDTIKRVAYGMDLWNRAGISICRRRQKIFVQYAAIFTNNQGTERANKDQNNAHKFQREEAAIASRLSATSWIREQCKAPILGQKKIPRRGASRIKDMEERIKFVWRKTEEVKAELGDAEYKRRLNIIESKLTVTFKTEIKAEARRDAERVVDVQHVPSVKEKVDGIHYSGVAMGILQYGKLFGVLFRKKTNNLELFIAELKGRHSKTFNRQLTTDEKFKIASMKIKALKVAVEADEKIRFSNEYVDGTICDSGYNRLFFKPRHTVYKEYEYSNA
jgi:hypothetical protein